MADLTAYLYGDVVTASEILSEVAMIFNGGSFEVAAKAAAAVGLLVGVISGILNGGRVNLATFSWPILAALIMIVPRVDLVIEDRSGGVAVVEDLPIGFAGPVSFITTIGNGVAELLTSNLGLDDVSVTMDNGHLIALRAPTVYAELINSPQYAELSATFSNGLSPQKDMKKYAIECLGTRDKSEIASEKLNRVRNSSIENLNVGVTNMVNVTASDGKVYSCSALWAALNAGFSSADFQQRLNGDINTIYAKYQGDTTTGARYQAALENLVPSASEFYRAAAVSGALSQAPTEVTSLASGGGSRYAALEDALNQKRDKNFGAAAVFFETIHETISFMEIWSFSIIPLVLILVMVGTVGVKVAGKYFWMLAWIQLWYPTLLIVISYLDVRARSLTSAITTVGQFDTFITNLLRLQDVGYMNMSMATALSMMLIFSTSQMLATNYQRDASGADHVDPKKTSPDSVSYAAMTQVSPMGTITRGAGETALNTGLASGLGVVTFSLEYGKQVQTGISSGNSLVTSTGAGTETSGGSQKTTETSQAYTRREGTGHDFTIGGGRTTAAGERIGFQDSAIAGQKATSQTGYSMSDGTQFAAGGGLSGAVGPGGAGGNGGIGAGVAGNIAAQKSFKLDQTRAQTSAQDVARQAGLSNDANLTRTAKFDEAESMRKQEGEERQDQERAADSKSKSDVSRQSESYSRSQSEGETSTATETGRAVTTRQVNAAEISRIIASKPEQMSLTRQMVDELGIGNEVQQMLDGRSRDLGNLFTGKGADDAKYAFAAHYVAQNLTGALQGERAEYANDLSDRIMNSTTLGSSQMPSSPTLKDLPTMAEPPSAKDIDSRAYSAIKSVDLDQNAVAKELAQRKPPENIDEFRSFLRERFGVDADKLTGAQLTAVMSSMRSASDAQFGKIVNNESSFGEMIRDTGWANAALDQAFSGMWGMNESTFRNKSIGEKYLSDLGDITGGWTYGNGALSPLPEGSAREQMSGVTDVEKMGSEMLDRRMSGVSSATPAAQLLALSQLEYGAEKNGHTNMAGWFRQQREDLIANDEVLSGSERTVTRIQALAMHGANDNVLSQTIPHAENEYAIGRTEVELEKFTGNGNIDGFGSVASWDGYGGAGAGGRISREDVVSYLVNEKGASHHVAQAMADNIADESGFKVGVEETTANRYGTRGIGLFQHTNDRRDAIESYLADRGTTIQDWKANLDYAYDVEMGPGGRYSGVLSKMEASGSRSDAAIIFLKEFENPAKEHRDSRERKYASLD
ncbi:hypothetical protein D2T29_12210 [Sinirhodobacter populi]|uniref:Phage tail lysozyme domain-containing protein n=1 Tax=Paenirhodobacter populi TaxID=2306993 RepID=A0A443KCE3_9RHOB|nr:phage tail tip lysozyme [Sinirhodobacter populi]RWR30430.1 hypothetical protein D2T29_12210 [Sinirhodobacter populi]